ncbi:MAG: exodeoxyribonuclease V subunit alpha [Gammaproteobacteria bacterium]
MNTMSSKNPMRDADAMIGLLEAWVQRDWLREIDLALTRFLWNEARDASPELLLATALTSHQLGRGHVCLDLQATLNDPYMALSLPPDQFSDHELEPVKRPSDLLVGMPLSIWADSIRHPDLVEEGHGKSPLVFDGERLYLRRYWQYERTVEAAIGQRLSLGEQIRLTLPETELKASLSALFPREQAGPTHWQKIACALASRSAFSIITGGPGTGKTTTVVRLLALLQSIALRHGGSRALRMRLAAPTGKAAARLKESISGAIHRLPDSVLELPGLRDAIPTEVITLHRLLGTRPDTRQFRHDARNPLALDVLVVDEASMVDLEMMAGVLSALPERARLILLGDKDQLASVEAGSVLGELCRHAREGRFTPATAGWIKAVTDETIEPDLVSEEGLELDQQIVMLRESYRFTAESGIGRLAAAVNAGDTSQITSVLQRGYSDLSKHDLMSIDDPKLEEILIGQETIDDASEAAKGYAHYLSAISRHRPPIDAGKADFDAWAHKVLGAHSRFQVLCALRNGPFGVAGLNHRIAEALSKRGLIHAATTWYEGRPILVTKNDYRLGLMNGDIGMTLGYPQRDKETGQLTWATRVAFPKSDGSGGVHWILPSRLLAVETVFALTVHKSQGSEFEHCALILPPMRNPVLTRELVYTGITRAKLWFSLITIGNSGMINEASTRTVQRSGGLFLKK